MSFIDGIFDKAADFVRDVFNIDDEPKQAAPKQERSKDLAIDSKTTFQPGDRESRPGVTPTGGLLDQLRDRASARSANQRPSAAADAPPHVTYSRDTAPPRESTPVQPPASAARATARVNDLLNGGSSSAEARAAAANVQRGLDYYASTFGRDGLDGAGAGVDVLVNDQRLDEHGKEMFKGNGGYFSLPDANGQFAEAIHFGVGKTYNSDKGLVEQAAMGYSDDLAIHELTHGIIRKATGHLGGEADEAGATNEAVADVMAAAATRDWSIGEGMYSAASATKRMRDIANPDDPEAVHGLWTSMDQVNAERAAGREVEEHYASGVISTAAQRVQSRFGGEDGWQVVEQVFYDTINANRLGDMSFQAVAGAIRTSAAALYGEGSSVDQVFDEELRRAGL